MKLAKRSAGLFFVLAGIAGLASAQPAAPAAETPPAFAGADIASLGEWFAANVRLGPEWRLRSYNSDALVLIGRELRIDRDTGHVAARIRVETTRPQTVDGAEWRSALVLADVDCRGGFVVFDRQNVVSRGQADPTTRRLITYSGQNETGLQQEPKAIAPGPVSDRLTAAVREICNVEVAERLDGRSDANQAALLKRGPADVEAWAKATLNFSGWDKPVYTTDAVTFTGAGIAKTMAPQDIRIRAEFIDPILGHSNSRDTEVARTVKGVGTVVPVDGRPIWVRSEVRSYRLDCRAMTADLRFRIIYVEHGLTNNVDSSTGSPGVVPIRKTMDGARLQAVCDERVAEANARR